MSRRPWLTLVAPLVVALAFVVATSACSGTWRGSSDGESELAPPASPVTSTPSAPPTSLPPSSALAAVGRPVPGAVPPGMVPPVVTSATAATAATSVTATAGVGGGGAGRVALTFDADLTPAMRERLRDGRVDSYANMRVIDILESTGTPATIFFTGLWMEEYPAETRRIVADPRLEPATHSQTHRAFTEGCYGLGVVPPDEVVDEVRRPIETLAALTDRATRYFRFPGLCHDDAALAVLAPLGVTVVDGDSSGDAGGRSVDAIVEQSLRAARPGAILVLHLNGGDAAPLTDEALPAVLDGLRTRDLRPVTLTELLAGGSSP